MSVIHNILDLGNKKYPINKSEPDKIKTALYYQFGGTEQLFLQYRTRGV